MHLKECNYKPNPRNSYTVKVGATALFNGMVAPHPFALYSDNVRRRIRGEFGGNSLHALIKVDDYVF